VQEWEKEKSFPIHIVAETLSLPPFPDSHGHQNFFLHLFFSPPKKFSLPLFLSHVLITDWIASHSISLICHIPLTAFCLPYVRLPKMPNQYIFNLKLATAMFSETLDNIQRLMRLIPESQSLTILNKLIFYILW
jgi:hypothetical protein